MSRATPDPLKSLPKSNEFKGVSESKWPKVGTLIIGCMFGNLDIADTYEDSKLYAKLSKEHPEGHVILNQQEKLILKSGLTYECRILQEFWKYYFL